ncbi:MAG: hypothetical protein AAF412_06175 [Pseudomonadota bacterium]
MTTVVFDVGNVLLNWDAKIPYRDHFDTESQIDAFFAEIDFYKWNQSLDAGKDWDRGVEELISLHPNLETEIRIFDERWHETIPVAIEQSVAVLKRLIGRHEPVYAITNFASRRWIECLDRFPFL